MADKYIKSTTPGHTWALMVYRGSRGVVAAATEGRPTDGGWETIIFQDRSVNIPVAAKRLTAKVQAEAMAALVQKLVDDGMAVAP